MTNFICGKFRYPCRITPAKKVDPPNTFRWFLYQISHSCPSKNQKMTDNIRKSGMPPTATNCIFKCGIFRVRESQIEKECREMYEKWACELKKVCREERYRDEREREPSWKKDPNRKMNGHANSWLIDLIRSMKFQLPSPEKIIYLFNSPQSATTILALVLPLCVP